VHKPVGGWRQIDPTLPEHDGALAPVATLADTRFSARGAGPLVSIPLGEGSVSFAWPKPLPTARVENDTAVYPDVLSGVDLRVRALADGFSWVLVVHSRAAAQNSELEELRFRLSATGLSVGERVGGGFQVTDSAGTTVLAADNALMWDTAESGPAKGTSSARLRAATELAAGPGSDGPLESPPDLARKAELPTTIDGDDLVVRPDLDVLRGKNAVYPVVIDPWTTIGKIRWGYANESNATRNDGVARVGQDPDGSGIGRAFFAFNLASLGGKQIRSAKFLTTMKHSYSCDATPVSLWRSADLTASGKQSWDGPNLAKWIEQRSGHAHKRSTGAGCGDDPQPDMPMEFAAAALENDIVANGRGTTNYTLALAARRSDGSGEGTRDWWKKFDPAATKLTVEYNTPPRTPAAADLKLHADYTAPAQPCTTGPDRPVVRSGKPWLKAVLSDPDGANGGQLSGVFTLERWNGSAWVGVPGWPKTDSKVPSGSKAELQITTDLTSGSRLRWRVLAKDGLGGQAQSTSPPCEFDVDATAPAVTPSVSSADGMYPEARPDDVERGSVGYSGRFTFGANGVQDIAGYYYQLNGGAERSADAPAAGGSVTTWITPTHEGENVLTVRSRDKAGNRSAPYDYVFLVQKPAEAAAAWSIDEGSGDKLHSRPVGGPTATLVGGPTWTDDRIVGTHRETGRARALRFNGTSESAATAGGVVDTARSFSVAAWVRLTKIGTTYQSIVSQEGSYTSAFFLQVTPGAGGRWRFVRHTQDAVGTGWAAAVSTSAPLAGVWTHVAGAYDAGTQELRVYVNGVLEGSASYAPAGAWNARGPMHIARAKAGGGPTDHLAADIGEVQVWDRVIDQRVDLGPLTAPVSVGGWEMDDRDTEAPRQVADRSGYGRPLTLTETSHATKPGQSAAQWGQGYNLSTGLVVDGVSGYAATASQVVRTDQSFTVSAWVRRDSNAGFQAVWGQDGTTNSAAYLRYQDNYPGGAWVFALRSKDDPTGTQIAAFAEGAPLSWVHVVGVFDAPAGEMRLYVNGELKAREHYRPTWDGTGPFSVGRMRYLGEPASYFNGAIDRLRVWQGALDADGVRALYAER
jgi:hypothetical protein